MFTGKDNYVFWFGVVEDRLDPLELGRVRVRILGFHPETRKDYPTNKLPWASVINSATSASLSGKGTAPLGLVDGSWVVGFFVDGEAGQVPIVIGSVTGMNETIASDENYGDGLKDIRDANLLKYFPIDEFLKREYPNGKNKFGDAHGAQLQNADASQKYPRENYAPDSSGRERGTPDLNILAINDPIRLDKTIVDIKRKPIGTGLRDTGIDVADCNTASFSCGVTNESGANIGTIKGLGIGSNKQESSSVPSRKNKSKQFIDKPTNNNGIRVDSLQTMTLNTSNLIDTAITTISNATGLA
jgi:hypothetical protein